MLFDDRYQVPPAPGEDREAPEAYPAGREHLGMAISGLGMIGMARMGLQSFGGDGDLFGVFGEKASDPMRAVLDFVRRGREIMNESDTGAGSTSQAVLATNAESDGASKLDDTVEQIAAARSARRERIQSLSQSLTQQKVRSAIDEAYARQDADTDAEHRIAKIVETGEDGTVKPGQVRPAEPDLGAPMTPEIDRQRALVPTPAQQREDRLTSRLTDLFSVDRFSVDRSSDPFLGFKGRPQLTDEAATALDWVGQGPEGPASGQRALLSRMSGDRARIRDEVLEAAWRQWKQSHPFETRPMVDPAPAEIAQYAVHDDEMLREIERRVEMESSTGIKSGSEMHVISEGAAGADRGASYADPVRQGAFDDVNIDEVASYGDLEASSVIGKDGVTENLAQRVQEKFDWLERRYSGNLDIEMERVPVGDNYHEMFKGTVTTG
jgi:hypothetical protein